MMQLIFCFYRLALFICTMAISIIETSFNKVLNSILYRDEFVFELKFLNYLSFVEM